MVGQGDDLVLGELDGTGFVYADVSRLRGNDAFVVAEQGCDDRGIGLRPSDQEMDIRIGAGASLADLLFRTLAVDIRAIPGKLFQVAVCQGLEYEGMGTFCVIAGK